MQLTADQMEVMREIRDRFKAGTNKSHYMCNMLGDVLGDWVEIDKISDDQEYALERSLRLAIQDAIANLSTFEGFMLAAYPSVKNMSEEKGREKFEEFMWQARMAWMDWIVETGSIETEYIKGK